MKLYKLTIPAVAAVMLAMTSCSDKGYWDQYDSPATYSFVAKSQSYSFEGNMPESIIVYVNRSDAEAAATVPVKLETNSDQVTGPSEVSFSAGQGQAEYVLHLGSGLVCGVNNVVTLTLGGDVEDHNIKQMTITLYREYTFRTIGEGSIVSPEALEYEWPVTVEVANENDHIFRIPDPYYVMYDDENATGVASMMITCSADFTVATFKNFYPGFQLSGYDIFFVDTDYGQIDGNEITFPVGYYAYSGGSLAGSFGTFPEVVVMPDGWNK